MAGVTPFWELIPLVLQALQMYLYQKGFKKYRKRLIELADALQTRAEERYAAYQGLRNNDPAFYAYYDSLPNYSACESNVNRSKGAAFADYGRDMRRSFKVNRGYSPLVRVHDTFRMAEAPLFNSANHRAVTQINERSRVDNHVLQRWNAIVRTPIHIEGASSHGVGSIINSSFATLKSFGRGFNSAGTTFGASLYRVLE